MFVGTDPRQWLARSASAVRSRGKHRAQAGQPSRLQLVEKGVVEPGMTREEVIMTIGYPPAHRTPSLSQPEWHYWKTRWHPYTVVFEGDRVACVTE